MPTMNEGIDGGLPTPPQETSFTVHNQQTGLEDAKRIVALTARRPQEKSFRVTFPHAGPPDVPRACWTRERAW